MTKHAKKGDGKAKSIAKLKVDTPDLDALRKPVLDADAALTKAETEATSLVDKAVDIVTQAKNAYLDAVARYREACRKAGVDCEFSVGGSANESQKLTFVVEHAENGVCALMKGKPKAEDIVPLAILKATIRKAAHGHTGKHVGTSKGVHNKGGSAGE
jgi:hypothetical protein